MKQSEEHKLQITARIEELREFLSERPKNAKVTSQLSYLLAQQAKVLTPPKAEPLQTEAVSLARKATELAPAKPFGYAALSVVSPEFKCRMQYLQQAIEYSKEEKHTFARAGLLVRLLVEPRDQEAKILRERSPEERVGKSSPKHPSRRDLDAKEEALYTTICQTLGTAWKQPTNATTPNIQEDLAGYEHKLGLFFRKRNPPAKHKPRSVHHFSMTCQKLPPSHPTHQMAQFWLATLQENNSKSIITRCPPDYIVGLYSTFAARFDSLLVESLHYQTPAQLRRLVDQLPIVTKTQSTRGVDLGCGTGLSGEAFRSLVTHLKGVDLSPEMVAKAQQRNCYDELVVGECTSVLDGQANLDFIVACDVLVYLGDLSDLFQAASASLTPETGLFAFSTELLADNKDDVDYVLHACARFAHSKAYIERLAKEHQLTMVGYTVSSIRKNQGKEVKGQLVALQRLQL